MNWLVKEEPTSYSFAALERDGKVTWSGVRNPLAQRHLRAIRRGDRVFYYHTGKEKAVVGVARALGNARNDPDDPTGRMAVVDFAPVERLPRPVPLATIKTLALFRTHPLVRMGRLSVMPVSAPQWRAIEKAAREEA
ncbi:MAG TPA: EVE domain-containing protein [Dongiaceae bacterium]|nr:EVE domain-containing protein [Dongiaceae bacterium]